ncbi:GntR family transcriptional regulator [Lentzea chajnantorensis]
MNPTPPFRRIAETLRRDILGGALESGAQLPSENELAERHQTTRTTVRKAIALLRSEGLVMSEQGRGIFVRPRPHLKMVLTGSNWRAHRGSGTSNFNAEAETQGRTATQQLLAVEETAAPPEIAGRLGIPAHTPVIVQLACGDPLIRWVVATALIRELRGCRFQPIA